jgi:drug/metabolite transporter (DMT)-like permease
MQRIGRSRFELRMRKLGGLFAFAFGLILLSLAGFRTGMATGTRIILVGYGIGLLALSVVVWVSAKRYPFLNE